jgi:hypothetical protein
LDKPFLDILGPLVREDYQWEDKKNKTTTTKHKKVLA